VHRGDPTKNHPIEYHISNEGGGKRSSKKVGGKSQAGGKALTTKIQGSLAQMW